MRGSSFAYLVKHGFQSLWLNRMMTFASIGILCACLIITGGFGMVGLGAAELFREVESQNEITVFIEDDVTEEETLALRNQIMAIEGVEDAVYTSREQAYENVREQMGSELLDGIGENEVFPASYAVSLTSNSYMAEVAQKIEALSGVEQVNAMLDVAQAMGDIGRTLLIVAGGLAAILIIVSIVVISNAIRLTVFARRREINIMKYVGATNRFIRLPFKVEGTLIGLIAAVLSFFALWGLCVLVDQLALESSISMLGQLSSSGVGFNDIWYYLLAFNVVFGVLIGIIASSSSMRKHLKV